MNLKIKKHISILLAGMLLFATMPLHSYAGDELRIEYLTKEESKRYDNLPKRIDWIVAVSSVYCEHNAYLIEDNGKIISDKYQEIHDFSEGLGLVEKDDKYGYIDKNGNEVIACKYDYADNFSEGLAPVEKDDKWGYIDKNGNEVIACKYEVAFDFGEGLALVGSECDDKGLYYIDKKGKKVIAYKYHDVKYPFSEGLEAVCKDDKWGYIDKSGNEVIAFKYDDIYGFSEGLAAVKKDGKWGYIDKSGNEVTACKYDYAASFSEGLAAVCKDDKCGYIDKSGNEVIACKYDYAEDFSEGLGYAGNYDEAAIIDKKGNKVIGFELAEHFDNPTLIKYHGRWGFVETEYLMLPATQKIIEKGIQRDKMMKVAVPAGAFVVIILIIGMLVLYLKKKKRKAAEFSNEGVYTGEVQAMDTAGYCTNCGKPYSNSTQFCGGCGQKLQKRQEK